MVRMAEKARPSESYARNQTCGSSDTARYQQFSWHSLLQTVLTRLPVERTAGICIESRQRSRENCGFVLYRMRFVAVRADAIRSKAIDAKPEVYSCVRRYSRSVDFGFIL